MTFDDLAGTWLLVGSQRMTDGIPPGNDIESEINNWLSGTGKTLPAVAEKPLGMVLNILPNGTFTESMHQPLLQQSSIMSLVKRFLAGSSTQYSSTSRVALEWFNDEGELENELKPFNGSIELRNPSAYILSEQAPAKSPDYISAAIRYYDPDTIVSDAIALKENLLVRTVNVVTDATYLNRNVYLYRRA